MTGWWGCCGGSEDSGTQYSVLSTQYSVLSTRYSVRSGRLVGRLFVFCRAGGKVGLFSILLLRVTGPSFALGGTFRLGSFTALVRGFCELEKPFTTGVTGRQQGRHSSVWSRPVKRK